MVGQSSSPTTDLIAYRVLLNDAPMNSSYQVKKIQVYKEINKIPFAVIHILDGDIASGMYPISSSSDFVPGTKVKINIGYHDTETAIFSGVVTKHSVNIQRGSASQLIIECKDSAVQMCIGRKNATFENSKDSDILNTLITSYGLSANVYSTTYLNKNIVQYYCSDWDFINVRAEYNGMLINVDQGKVNVFKPDTSQSPVLKLVNGKDIFHLEIEADVSDSYSSVNASSWNIQSQTFTKASSQNSDISLPGNFKSSDLSTSISSNPFTIQSNSPMEEQDIQVWAQAYMTKSQLSMIRGNVSFQGSDLVIPGCIIELDNCGDRFNGNCFVSGVVHSIDKGNWITTVQIGMTTDWYVDKTKLIESSPASGVLPGISGLQNAIVKQINSDPDGESRVLVTIPVFNNKDVWARLSNPYATVNAGMFFYPEVGDEVILAFVNNDPRYPIILGSLYGTTNAPPFTPDDKNTNKAIVTKGQVKIQIDDDKKILTIITPGNNSIVLDDSAGKITFTDQNKNSIEMSSSGIVINSASDLKLSASGNITISAQSNITASATNELSLSGVSISADADNSLALSGNASAKLSASGETSISGLLVKIN